MSHYRLCGLAGFLLAGIVACASIEPLRLLAASQAQTPKTSTQERLNRVGANLFSRGDRIPEAVRELKEILALDPRSAEGHFLLGIAYRMLGSAEMMGEAVAEFRQALALDSNHGPANRHLAEVYLLQGLYPLSFEHAVLAEKLGFPLPEDKRKLLQEKLRGKETERRK